MSAPGTAVSTRRDTAPFVRSYAGLIGPEIFPRYLG
jgi:hypothetical protein